MSVGLREFAVAVAYEDPVDPRLSAPLVERPGVRKSRVGGWRILFSVDQAAEILYVLTIDVRGQVYKHS